MTDISKSDVESRIASIIAKNKSNINYKEKEKQPIEESDPISHPEQWKLIGIRTEYPETDEIYRVEREFNVQQKEVLWGCYICDKESVSEDYLTRDYVEDHVIDEHYKKAQCHICHKKFWTSRNVAQHLIHYHHLVLWQSKPITTFMQNFF